MVHKTCPICGTAYSVAVYNDRLGKGKTCSYACGRKLTAQRLSGPKLRVTIYCEQCGKEIVCAPNVAKTRRFCSKVCSGAAQQIRSVVACARCGKSMQRSPWHASRTGLAYCSRACHSPPVEIKCEQCGKQKRISPSALREHNFCSRSCSSKWSVIHIPRSYPERVRLTCNECGIDFERQPNAVGDVNYCSSKCFGMARQGQMSGDNNPAWRGGFAKYYGPHWKQQARRARQRDEFTCRRCGAKQDTLGYTLHVHHIQPLRSFKKDFRKANALENLVSLCRPCHTSVEWNGIDF